MQTPEIEEKLPNYSNKFRREICTKILSCDECRVTLMSTNSTKQPATKCSPFVMSGDEMPESSEKRERQLYDQVTGQQIPAAAAAEVTTNEYPVEVMNGVNVEILDQSSTVNVQAKSELLRKENLSPFVKSSFMWNHIESLEVFRIIPQKPHFCRLLDCNEETREGSAIGHMLTFASVVEKVTKLQIDDPRSLFDSYLEALDILEVFGFDVKAVVDCVNALLILKSGQKQLEHQSKRYQSLVAECDERNAKMAQEISVIDKMMSELEEQRAAKVSQKVKEDSCREFLQLQSSDLIFQR